MCNLFICVFVQLIQAFKWSERAMKMGDLRGWFDVAYSTEFGLGTSMDPANQLRIWCWGKRGCWFSLFLWGGKGKWGWKIQMISNMNQIWDVYLFRISERLCGSVCSRSLKIVLQFAFSICGELPGFVWIPPDSQKGSALSFQISVSI